MKILNSIKKYKVIFLIAFFLQKMIHSIFLFVRFKHFDISLLAGPIGCQPLLNRHIRNQAAPEALAV